MTSGEGDEGTEATAEVLGMAEPPAQALAASDIATIDVATDRLRKGARSSRIIVTGISVSSVKDGCGPQQLGVKDACIALGRFRW